MAIARQWLRATYNRPGFDLFDFNVYALCGDGDMMEGVASEAASLAGHLRLSNLCWIYDSNRVTIEGPYRYRVHRRCRGPLPGLWLERAARDAMPTTWTLEQRLSGFPATRDRPTLIVVHSHIGYGAPHKHDRPSAWRTAWRRRSAADQGVLRLRSRPAVRGSRRRARAFRRQLARAAPDCARRGWNFRRYRASIPTLASRSSCLQNARAAARLGNGTTEFAAEHHRHFDARCIGQGAECDGRASSMADRRRG